ncbi:hypothetical protein [uncultured Thomasclavelia sp.]|uniref:hypothetical protein n=1 Tax=uncultured Thomasclavelia sp. TaxID=3025759 RepID=UPI0025DFC24C|nr:hypothetical protein [uncultured Thomasclavelia sp.]
MKEIDIYSYQCGVMDCFAEMVKAGVKKIALAHPWKTIEERETYLPFVKQICQQYQISYYLDDDPLITDLFPMSMNKDTFNIIFYRNKEDILKYQEYKKIKNEAIKNNQYASKRYELAKAYGSLLGYSQETIDEYIKNNHEKEEF